MDTTEKIEFLELDDSSLKAILGHCLINTGFLRGCAKCLDYKAINNLIISDIYKFVVEYYNKYSLPPTRMECESYILNKYTDLQTSSKYRLVLAESIDRFVKEFRIGLLQDKISAWLKVVEMRRGYEDGIKLFNSKNYDRSAETIKNIIVKLKNAEFGRDERVDMTDIESNIKSFEINTAKACTIGHPEFDELMLANSLIKSSDVGYNPKTLSGMTRGSLLPGEQTIIIGPSNSGKTTAITTIAVSNMAMGKKVLMVGLEDPKEKMVLKLAQSFCQLDMTVLQNPSKEDKLLLNQVWTPAAVEYLHYYEWIKPGKMYAEDIYDLLSSKQEEELSKNKPGFDLVIVDYPGLLKLREGRVKDSWDEKREIYATLKQIAKKYGWHSLTPIQTNREGFKSNKAGEEMLDLDNIAQGFGIGADADNVITINRNKADYEKKWVRFHLAKSRSNTNKKVFISRTDYAKGRTHGLGYGFAICDTSEKERLADTEGLARSMDGKTLQSRTVKELAESDFKDISINIPTNFAPIDQKQSAQKGWTDFTQK